MAGVLGAMASYITGMLTEMAKEEVSMMIGVSGEIDKLGIMLGDLKNFLADADRRNITDESVWAWVEELKRAMYDVTDILDLCQLKVMEQGPSSKDVGCLNPLLFCMRNPLHSHDIGIRIKKLNEKLDGICRRGSIFNFSKLEACPDRRPTRPLFDRGTDPLLERSGVVGDKIEEDTQALVEMLTKDRADESGSHMVVAIVGVGGIGKTTLCKKIFNNETIQSKFTKKIWLSITNEFNEVELLRTAIIAANGDLPGPGGGSQNKALLVPALANAIRDKKFFLVLDDMWGANGWNNLLKAPFGHGALSSRVLITTRHDNVARGMKANYPHHHVDKLELQDAWSLLKKQIQTTEKSEPDIDMLKDIGLKIIKKCDGLPLAIKVIGGLLCQRDIERREWEKVLNDSTWSVSQMPEELNYAIYLSYEDLSSCLKQCFLHFSLKPKKIILDDMQFVNMWIGEGFVHGNSDRLEEIGREYHKELRLRNLIEQDTSHASQYVCNMHDVVRSFAQYVTRSEALVAHNGENVNSKLSLQRFLRLSIETKGVESDEFEWKVLQEQKSLRSLMIVGNLKFQSGDTLVTFSSLRTLHIESVNFSMMVESLYKLKHLRYLSMDKCTDISGLPGNIHKMKFLQHLSLEGCENLVKLPNNIVKLQELRYLQLEGTGVSSIPRGFHALTNLRTLSGFRVHMDGDWCSLEELGPLSQLRGIGLVGLENVSDASFVTKVRLQEKVHLSGMRLLCKSRLGEDGLVEGTTEKDQGIIEEVFNELCPPPSIEIVSIEGYFGHQLPRWMMSATTTPLNGLKVLVMADLACCTQLPNGLCQLPWLEYLQVNRAPAIKAIGSEFVWHKNNHGHPPTHTVTAFPRLHEMELIGLVELEEWEWEEKVQAMPFLKDLWIQHCKLSRLPPGLSSHGRALKILSIYQVQHLRSLENFACVVELKLHLNPDLTRISNFPKLQKLEILCCEKLEFLQEMPVLRKLLLTISYDNNTLPQYLQTSKPSHLLLNCSPEVLVSMSAGKYDTEWEKFSHIQQVEAFADDQEIEKRWHLFYTREPYNMETNMEKIVQDQSEYEDNVEVAGAGYTAYRVHRNNAYIRQLARRRHQLTEQAANELVKNTLQTHFQDAQRISDTNILPFAMDCLRSRIMEELDISHLTERLLKGTEGESSALTWREKLDTWERIKILSFTRAVSSMWGMTLLSLNVRVQVTILSKHIYLEYAPGTDGAQLQAESDTFSRDAHRDFLATADYLPTYGITAFIMQMQHAATEILKEKKLKDPMSMDQVLQTVLQILDQFMSLCEDNSWINYLVPENANRYAQLMAVSSSGSDDSSLVMDLIKLDQLMTETHIVLASHDFRNIMDMSLRKVASVVIEDLGAQVGAAIPPSGLPLARLLPKVAQLSSTLLEEPNKNKHIQTIRSMPEVDLFCANMPPQT